MTRKKILPMIVTGAHSVGKTHLCNDLMSHGYFESMITETARTYMNQRGWTTDDLKDPDVYQEFEYKLLALQLEKEKELKYDSFLSDRGLDALMYLEWKGYEILSSPDIESLIDCHTRYFTVLIEPHIECIEVDGVRMQSTLEELWVLHNIFVEKLAAFGIHPFVLKQDVPLSERTHVVMTEYYKHRLTMY
jgi:nicotinamide riboside kinase